jgi:hypothetical protein
MALKGGNHIAATFQWAYVMKLKYSMKTNGSSAEAEKRSALTCYEADVLGDR